MYRISACVLALALITAPLRAQSTNATLSGRITDPSKSLIGGARVAAVSAGTNLRYETTTGGSGDTTPATVAKKTLLGS